MAASSSTSPGCCACFGGLLTGGGGGVAKTGSDRAHQLSAAIQCRDAAAVRAFCRRLSPDEQALGAALLGAALTGDAACLDANGRTPLQLAIAARRCDIAEQLLQAGASCADEGEAQALRELAPDGSTLRDLIVKRDSISRTQQFTEGLLWLPKVPLFASLDPAEFPAVAGTFETRRCRPGDTIVRQGDAGDELFMIRSGSFQVTVASSGVERPVAVLKAGDYFGEAALLTNAPRNATVTALDEAELRVLSRTNFKEMGLHRKLRFKKRQNLFLGCAEELPTEIASSTKSPAQLKVIKDGMLANENFGPVLKILSVEQLDDIARSAVAISVRPPADIITQGDLQADQFFVVEKGLFTIIVDGSPLPQQVGPGGSFGELALLYRAPRKATVRCTEVGVLWALSRHALRVAVQAPLRRKLEEFAMMMEKVPPELFGGGHVDRELLASALVETTYDRGSYITRQGEEARTMFFLREGEVLLEKNGTATSRLQANGAQGATLLYFGEQALIHDSLRSVSVRAVSAKVKVLALGRETFLAVKGIKDKTAQVSNEKRVSYSLQDMQTIGLLGCGGFGTVTLVWSKPHRKTFALKKLSKGWVVKQKQEASVINEKCILQMTHSPFLVSLYATFNTSQHLHFLLEPAMGGELFNVYIRKSLYGSEAHARFYTACVVKAFEHLHQRHVLYRDLKPENLLLTGQGYCKMTDFGLAKFVIGYTYTACGTPEYFAPELTLSMGHSMGVDWWTLGILLYEFMSCQSPFQGSDTMQIFRKVQAGIENAVFPGEPSWKPLVLGLCQREPSQRLAMQPHGIENVFRHQYFEGFDWKALEDGTMDAPYKPTVHGSGSLANFDTVGMREPPELHYADTGTGWDKDFECTLGPLR